MGVRGGAATLFYPAWHREFRSLIVLKNNRGSEDSRIRQLDYGVQLNGYLIERMKNKQPIYMFCPNTVPGLYEAFFADQEKFAELYEAAIEDESIERDVFENPIEFFKAIVTERAQTGRIYIQFVDNTNEHMPFDPEVAPVKQSNLCVEIALPTKPLKHVYDEEGEIALCTLAAFNLLKVNKSEDFARLAPIVVRVLDALLDYQDYPLPAAKTSTELYRPLGVGIVNYAAYLAENEAKYGDKAALRLTHEVMESMQFHLMQASVELAKEKGRCKGWDNLVRSKGVLPIDTYNKNVDKFADYPLREDWEGLRAEMMKHGMRNATLTALMPSETSSQVLNATNGIEPPRGLMSPKRSKDGVCKQLVPGIGIYHKNYTIAWDIDNMAMIQSVGVMQKFLCQTASTNGYYDPEDYPGGQVPFKVLMKHLAYAHFVGLKTLYYHNTKPIVDDKGGREEVPEDDGCDGGGCKI